MNNELEKVKAQLAEALERIATLEEFCPQVNAQKLLAAQRKANEEREAQEKAERERAEAQRKRIESERHEYIAPPKKVLCERTGEYVLESVASHICSGGRCVHNAKKALACGQINKLQYNNIAENDQLETGCILPVALAPTKDPYADLRDKLAQVPNNPLTDVADVRRIEHLAGGV